MDPKKIRQMSGVKIFNLLGTNHTRFEKVCAMLVLHSPRYLYHKRDAKKAVTRTGENKEQIRESLTRDRQKEVDLSESSFFSIRTAQACKPIGDRKLKSKEFANKLVVDSRLPRNWFRLYRRQETRDFVVKEFVTPCRRIIRGIDAVRAYMDELPGVTQEEVDEKIARFSKRTRGQYDESLAAEEKRVETWECNTCGKEFASKTTLMEHRKGHAKEPSDAQSVRRTKRKIDRRWKCGRCGNDFEKREQLRQHQKEHEEETPDDETSDEGDDEQVEKRERKKKVAQPRDERGRWRNTTGGDEMRPIVLWPMKGQEPTRVQMSALERGNGTLRVYGTPDGRTVLIDGIRTTDATEAQDTSDNSGSTLIKERRRGSSTGRNRI